MSRQDKHVQAITGVVVPPADVKAQAASAQPEQLQDQPSSDKELDKVSGGVWRGGRWFPF